MPPEETTSRTGYFPPAPTVKTVVTDSNPAPQADAPVPPAPRPLSRAAYARSWMLPQVRIWWIMTIVVLLVTITVGITQYQTWSREAQLINHGLRVEAKLAGYEKDSYAGGKVSHPGEMVWLSFKNGPDTVWLRGMLPLRNDAYLNGTLFPVRVDPKNFENWTMHTTPRALFLELMGAFTLLPVLAILLFAGWLKRRGVLRIWERGEARQAVVIDSSRPASAPDAMLVRCTLANKSDPRVLRVMVPRYAGKYNPGDTLWLLTAPGALEPALPVSGYPA